MWIIPEITAFIIFVPVIILEATGLVDGLLSEIYSSHTVSYFNPVKIFWNTILTSIGFWTICAYVLVWRGALQKEVDGKLHNSMKGLVIMGMFVLFAGTTLGSYFLHEDWLQNSRIIAAEKKCAAVFFDFQKELTSIKCITDSDCSVNELQERERKQIREPYGSDLYFTQQREISSKFFDLESCGNLRLYCEAGKCVPKK